MTICKMTRGQLFRFFILVDTPGANVDRFRQKFSNGNKKSHKFKNYLEKKQKIKNVVSSELKLILKRL